ncbi:unnamed protein product [Oppiella nova]|uniref:Inositol polyphosphate-related phosphatase domain-containing protein n=1 Tax=Oppiella nova TaxID=334625 RepID=A0A7R9LUU6_9ACAR|nr:unnamed protein product [Oppiella nova]CAG2166527.1 unnamed protein product [Oppiella nova]
MITWNVKDEQCKSDLTQLLGLETTGANGHQLADIYAIGLQEVPFETDITESPTQHTWANGFAKVLGQLEYVLLKRIGVTNVGRQEGSKGALTVRFIVNGVSVCIVNTHLTPHDQHLDQRIDNYNDIIGKQNILSDDYVLWMGDLNFRIDDLTADEIHDTIISTGSFAQLLAKDQLNRVKREGRAFSEFSETVPSFAPTYKFLANTNNYDFRGQERSRKPAYTDRILYRVNPDMSATKHVDLKQMSYKSYPQYVQSDHKPVSALFLIKFQ